jgi:hypothetical protein
MAADQAVERASRRLQELADRFAGEDSLKAKLAQPLADDAEFLRKLKPSLIKARAKGELPTDEPPATGHTTPRPTRPTTRRKPKRPSGGGGPSPWLVVGAAVVVGVALAKVIDWRSHAHPRN